MTPETYVTIRTGFSSNSSLPVLLQFVVWWSERKGDTCQGGESEETFKSPDMTVKLCANESWMFWSKRETDESNSGGANQEPDQNCEKKKRVKRSEGGVDSAFMWLLGSSVMELPNNQVLRKKYRNN